MKKTMKAVVSILFLSAFLVACDDGGVEDTPDPETPEQDAPAEDPIEGEEPGGDPAGDTGDTGEDDMTP